MDGYQTTLQRLVSFQGIGLHSGRAVRLEVLPAKADTGIRFLRTDIPDASVITAEAASIGSTELSTCLGTGRHAIQTVEHLMAALVGAGIDNALVRLDGPEVPIMDGSAAPFLEGFRRVGLARLAGFRRLYLVKKPFEVRDGDRVVRIEPDERLRYDCTIDFSGVIGRQRLAFTFSRTSFLDLCDSRTFCHVREVDAMRSAGLALGGSLDNAVVVTDDGVLNSEGLRAEDEFVRHKLLDAIGDLALLGAPLVGRVTLVKSGHSLHARFMRELLARKAELLTVFEVGSFRGRQPAMPESLQAISAAAAIYG